MSTVIGIVKTTFPTEETLEGEDAETMTWQKICSAPLELPRLAVGEPREFGDLMRGLRFLIVGYFNKITVDKKNLTQDILKGYIRDMGGFIYDKDQAEVVMRNHSDILNFYVVIQNEEQLINATGDKQEIEDMRMKLNLPPNANHDTTELTTDAESTSVKRSSRGRPPKRTVNQDNTVTKIPPNANQDTTELITDAESTSIKRSSRGRPRKRTVNQDNTATKIPPKKRKRTVNQKFNSTKNSTNSNQVNQKGEKLKAAALTCRKFASGGFKFITADYVLKMKKSSVILDPKGFIIEPGRLNKRTIVNDMRPLLMSQIDQSNSTKNMSAIVALKKHRGERTEMAN